MRALTPVALLFGFSLAGCTTDSAYNNYAFVVQDKYDHLKCPELAGQITFHETERKKLLDLRAKASQSGVGSVVGAGAYGPGINDAQGHLRVLRITYDKKNCAAELAAAAAEAAAPAKIRR